VGSCRFLSGQSGNLAHEAEREPVVTVAVHAVEGARPASEVGFYGRNLSSSVLNTV
jgi:hypothetical protein